MEALSGVCSNSLSLSFQNHKNPVSLSQPTSASVSFYSHVKSKSWIPLKINDFHDLAQFLVPKKRFKCLSSINRLETSSDDLKSGIRKKNLAVFLSGGGSNFRALHEATLSGTVHGDFVVLVTDKHDSGGVQYARDKGIPVIIYPSRKSEPGGLTPNDLVTALSKNKVDFILLAGYLKLIPAEVIRAYTNSILNIHPSLLPSFGGKGYYGLKVHKAVIASGARYSGPTIHFVDENYDTGRILAQRIVPVLANDTAEELAARVLRQEHKMYVEVAAAVCEERIIWREDGVPLIRTKANPHHYS